jgi:hypothetical protein
MVLGRNMCLNIDWTTRAWAPHFAMRMGIDVSTFVLINLRSTHERRLGKPRLVGGIGDARTAAGLTTDAKLIGMRALDRVGE